ncbi:DNA topoisomerase IB [Cognatilysobacter bugurensis]|uniref:DNA topoisomerase IB n=1 Tax=Cognatilysobacter bugurensis TaxID=543356 RepID=UPI0027E3F8EB|nr:DNA topoisomerase IB [Lysobacter bugurensis]
MTPARAAANDAASDAVRIAREAGLRHVCDASPGIKRRRDGDAFVYETPDGERLDDEATLARIAALAIPPAYTDVWICPRANGHLQATGRDARGRKQYRYHAHWQAARGDGKFERVIEFGEALPKLRRRLRRDLARRGHPREKVLAIVVAVMAETLVRVGNDVYARRNNSFGLTTLRNRHVAFLKGGRARFKFRGKAGLEHEIVLDDARLAKLVRACQQLPGQSLFQYRDDDGAVQPVNSDAVNDYLREAMGASFTAKDFRTWGGTLTAVQCFAATPLPIDDDGRCSERALAAAEKAVVGEVARALGNTVAVCRRAYIDPAVFDGWRSGALQRVAEGARGARQWERATLQFLRDARRRAARSERTRSRRG